MKRVCGETGVPPVQAARGVAKKQGMSKGNGKNKNNGGGRGRSPYT
jgi:hypothetical protein